MKRNQKMNLQNMKLLTLAFIFFSSISLDAYADDNVLSTAKLAEIENRIDSMNAFELNQQRNELIAEAAFLQAEQGASQSPSRSKAIASRLSEVTAELNFIQKALIALGSLAVINNLTDDDYNDNVPPVITINGSASLTVELGSAYSDAGASANDANYGSTAVTSSGTVDTNTVGTYTITYTATDKDGNTATATRSVSVVDTTQPVVSVTGDNPATTELGGTYTDAGATATDASGSVTVVTTGTVDTTTLGAYTLTYTSTDASGNAGTATRTVNVTDTTAPEIVVTGDNPATVELAATYTDAGATATDASGDVTVVTTGTVDTTTVGAYTLTYTSTDASGNAGTATRTVNVTDTTAPEIVVTGDNPATVELAATYTDAGATATDASGDVTVVASGGDYQDQAGSSLIDAGTLGTYTITYTSTDASGNAGTATRTVTVVDTTAPVFTSSPNYAVLEGVTNIGNVTVEQSTLATKLIPGTGRGIVVFTIASSDISIDSSSALLTFNEVQDYDSKYDEKGELKYTALVKATDPSGNYTIQTITVNVLNDPNDDTGRENATGTGTGTGMGTGTGTGTAGDTAPVITVAGSTTVTVELGDVYTDAGATAIDDSGEIITVVASGGDYKDQMGGSTLIDSGTIGVYTITYTAIDSEDNESTATRTVTVADTTAPVFTSSEVYNVVEGITNIGNATVEQSTRATRLIPGTGRGIVYWEILSDDISIDSSSALLTFNEVQDYDSKYDEKGELKYTALVKATDPSGNYTIQTITVNVLNDPNDDTGRENATGTGTGTGMGTGTGTGTAGDTAPVITVAGSTTVTVELGDVYTDAGATAIDDSGEIITVVASGGDYKDQMGGSTLIDSGTIGVYTITYTAIDSEDNESTATRTVTVADTTAPVFTSSEVYNVVEGITNIGNATVEQSTRATRLIPGTGRGIVVWTIVSNDISIDSSSALLTFNEEQDYDSKYDEQGKLEYTAVVTATDPSGNATSQTITVAVLNDNNDDTGYAEGATSTGTATGTGTGTGTGTP